MSRPGEIHRALISWLCLSVAAPITSGYESQFPLDPQSTQVRHQSFADEEPGATLFGISIAVLGDVDGDGEDDVAIGAPMAWSENGRTGAVLIVGVKSQKLHRILFGTKDGSWFGKSIHALPVNPKARYAMLGIDGFGVFDPAVGDATILIPGGRIYGVQNDIDGDGLREVVTYKTVSSRSGTVLDKSPDMQDLRLLSIDVDGDGFWDMLRVPKELDREVVLCSGIDGSELLRLALPGAFQDSESGYEPSAIAANMDKDGKHDLVLTLPDLEEFTSQLLVYSGVKFDQRRSIPVQVPKPTRDNLGSFTMFSETYRRPLHNCGDLNGDGIDDILAAAVDWSDLTLTCYSGVSGSVLWKAEKAVEEHRASIARTNDMDGDGVAEVLSGAVLYLPNGVQYGLDGLVHVLSGKTGAKLKDIEERSFPQISHANHTQKPSLHKSSR